MKSYNATPSKDYEEYIVKFLAAEGREVSTQELYDYIKKSFPLTRGDEELKSDGSEPVWKNMVRRSITTLKKRGQVVSPKRGTIQIGDGEPPKKTVKKKAPAKKTTTKAAKEPKAPKKVKEPAVSSPAPAKALAKAPKIFTYRIVQYDRCIAFEQETPGENDIIKIQIPYPAVIHWGVNGWKMPPENTIPESSWIAGNVCETEFQKGPEFYELNFGPFKGLGVNSLDFVIRYYDGGWSLDFSIRLQ